MKAVNIICMKWGDKYGPDYVNRLYSMIKRNISRSFLLTCFTDNGDGIDTCVSIKALPELGLPANLPERGWNKLATLASGLGGLQGDVLFLDLDVVIVSSIDDLFSYPGKFLIIKDQKLQRKRIGNSSVYRFEISRYQSVLDDFKNNFEWVKNNFRNEQAYLSYAIDKLGELEFWPESWCPSFKYACVAPWPLSYVKAPRLPSNSKVVIFHGHPLPDEAIIGKTHNWYRPIRPTKWIREHWV